MACKPDPETNSPDNHKEKVDLVYPMLDAANSRWFYFSSACRPFGMVNLSPDNQTGGAWGSGYRYHTDTIKGFSHIHAWQLAGVSVMPQLIAAQSISPIAPHLNAGQWGKWDDYYSPFNHETEIATPGYHKVILDRYNITVELTSTTRVGFHQYTFPEDTQKGILFNLGGLLGPSEITDGKLNKIDDQTLSGSLYNAPTRRRPKSTPVFFYVKFNHPVEEIESGENGKYLVKIANGTEGPTQMKVAISYTSVANAQLNLETELPDWDFEAVVKDSKQEWNDLLGRIEVKGGTEQDQRRFYTDLWHALQGRRIISDVNGQYPDMTGDTLRIGQIPVRKDGKPKFNHYNSDSFWGAQWTINTLWGLAYPEIYEEFVNSLLVYYRDGGWIPRGPSGGNYTHVMTGASSTPFIVSAYQKGIRAFDHDLAWEGLKKNHLPGGTMGKAGYEHKTAKGGGIEDYIEKGYVPYPNPNGNFGYHQDGPSLTMEYAYQDWTLAQLAKAMNKPDDAAYFLRRSKNYKNTFDPSIGWMRPKDYRGNWREPYDPYEYDAGFNESNGAQSTWFVPHDLEGLAELMGGKEAAIQKLNQQFETAEKQGFTSGTSHDVETNPELRRIPINYGNQPSIQTAFIFHILGRPDLTQYWSRKVTESVYKGLNPDTGYNGDEDQGLMGSLAVLLKAGLFQMNGGTDEDPEYQIGSPIFDEIVFHLHPGYAIGKTFTIQVKGNSEDQVYVQSASLNNKLLEKLVISHSDLIRGGKLVLEMGGSNPEN